jgi:hypothetical protein
MLVNKFVSLFKNKWIKIALCFLLFAASAIIIIAMLLGQEAGTFVIQVQDGNLNKSISITLDNPNGVAPSLKSKLTAEGADNMSDYNPQYFLDNNKYSTLTSISSHMGRWLGDSADYVDADVQNEQEFEEHKDVLYVKEIVSYDANGEVDDYFFTKVDSNAVYDPNITYYTTLLDLGVTGRSLYAYSFYVVNTSTDNTSVQYKASMTYNNVSHYCDEISRIMIFTQGTEENSTKARIYYKPEDMTREYSDKTDFNDYEDSKDYYLHHGYNDDLAPLQGFSKIGSSSGTVFANDPYRIEAGGYMKFTVLFWLEGEDPDEDYYGDDIYSGTIKFGLTLSVDMTV